MVDNFEILTETFVITNKITVFCNNKCNPSLPFFTKRIDVHTDTKRQTWKVILNKNRGMWIKKIVSAFHIGILQRSTVQVNWYPLVINWYMEIHT